MFLRFLINLITLFSIISLFNLVRYSLKIKKVMKMQEDNPNIKGIVVVNGQIKIIEKKPEEREFEKPHLMVQDEVCGKWLKQEEAYCVFMDGRNHYFCSWECREAFLKGLHYPTFLRREKQVNED